jgi:putative transcriptional regulator
MAQCAGRAILPFGTRDDCDMVPMWLQRTGLVLLAILLPSRLLYAALPSPEEASPHPSLTGQLLVAAPSIGDPRFERAVILIVSDGQTGSMGIVINKPIGERPFAELLASLGEKDPQVTGNIRIFSGGPVQPQIGFVLHTSDYHRPETVFIDARLAMTSDLAILHDIGNRRGPAKSLVAFGYAGWAPGQLRGEIEKHAWATADGDAALVFDFDRDKLWDEATRRRTEDL